MGRAVSDQVDLPQNQEWLLCSNGQGCLRSDRSSTAPGEAVIPQLSTLSQIRSFPTPGAAVVQQLSTLSQIRYMFHNTRGVGYTAMSGAVSHPTDLPQRKESPLFSDGQGCVRSDGSSTTPMGGVVRRSSRPSTKPHSGRVSIRHMALLVLRQRHTTRGSASVLLWAPGVSALQQ